MHNKLTIIAECFIIGGWTFYIITRCIEMGFIK